MEKDYLTLKRASASRLSGEWNDDDYGVLCDGVVVGRIMKAAAVPVGMSWMWTLAFGHHEDCTPMHGFAASCALRCLRDIGLRPSWLRSIASAAFSAHVQLN